MLDERSIIASPHCPYVDEYDIRNKLIWLAPYFPITAFLALFTHILHNPLDSRADADLVLMSQTINSLRQLVSTDDQNVFSFITGVVADSLQIAKQHVQDSRTRSAPPTTVAGVTGGLTTGERKHPRPITAQPTVFDIPAASTLLPNNLDTMMGTGGQAINDVNPFAVPAAFEPSYQADFDFNGVDFTTQLADQGQYNTQGISLDDPFLLLEYGEWDWTSGRQI
ncbi:hypothetical protein LTR41_011491 [Exophiala xenobiotica]|nr:hypothetical protein LTR41_011491 [Exophiala xenobiotica]KAK5550754.1 hypothetical protein LTR46_011244 [Exophiala xenobiotica]